MATKEELDAWFRRPVEEIERVKADAERRAREVWAGVRAVPGKVERARAIAQGRLQTSPGIVHRW